MNKKKIGILSIVIGVFAVLSAVAVILYIFRDKIFSKPCCSFEKTKNKKIPTSDDFEDFDAPEEISFDDFVSDEDIEDLNQLDGVEENIIYDEK